MDADLAALETNPPNVYHFLWKKNAIGESCRGFSIPDTVVFENFSPRHWYFMSKTNQILRKNPSNVSLPSILEAFIPKTSTNSKRGNPIGCTIVAVLIYPTVDMEGAPVTYLEHLDARSLRKRMNRSAIPESCILQKFVYPKGDYNTTIRALWTGLTFNAKEFKNVHRATDSFVPLIERAMTHEGQGYAVNSKPLENCAMASELAAYGTYFASHVGYTSKRRLWNAEVYFKVGKNDVMYLLYARELKLLLLHEHFDNRKVPRIIAPPKSITKPKAKPRRKCPNCDKVELNSSNKFMVSLKTVIEAHHLPSNQDDLDPNKPNLGALPYLPYREIKHYTKTAAEYLSRIERRDKESQLRAARKMGVLGNARSAEIPRLILNTVGQISKEKYVELRSDATFLYRFVHVCEDCSKQFVTRKHDDRKVRCQSAGPLRTSSAIGSKTDEIRASVVVNTKPKPSRPRSAFPFSYHKKSNVEIKPKGPGPRTRKLAQAKQEPDIKRVEDILYQLGLSLKRDYGTLSVRTVLAPSFESPTAVVYDLVQLQRLFQKANLPFNLREWTFLVNQLHLDDQNRKTIDLEVIDRLIGDVFLITERPGARIPSATGHKKGIMFRRGYDSQQHTVLVKGVVREWGNEAEPAQVLCPPRLPKQPTFSCLRKIDERDCNLKIYALESKKKNRQVYVEVECDEIYRRTISLEEIILSMEQLDSNTVRKILGSKEALFQYLSNSLTIENDQIVLMT